MTDLEQAWQKLGLKPGSPLRDAMEAHRDLSAVWEPHRFADNPRLQRRAAQERAALDDAFATVRRHLAADAPITAEAGRSAPEAPVSPKPEAPRGEPPVRPSLYEESLADRSSRKKIPYGWIVVGLTALAMIIRLFIGSGEETASGPAAHTPEFESGMQLAQDPPLAEQSPDSEESSPASAPPESPSANEVRVPGTPSPTAAQPPAAASPQRQAVSRTETRVPAASNPAAPPPAREEAPQTAAEPAPANSVQAADSPVAKAFQLLREKRELVEQLATQGRSGNLELIQWQPIRSQPPEILIDVVARRQGEEIHLIWAVNLDRQTVRAMSQAARDIEAAAGTRPKLDRPS